MRVVIADDAVLFREGVANLLRESGYEVVGQAGNAVEFLALVRDTHPDIVLVDIRMPPTHRLEGLEAAREIRTEHPDIGVLVLSQHVEAHYALRLFEDATQGAGYLLKDRVGNVAELTGDPAGRRRTPGHRPDRRHTAARPLPPPGPARGPHRPGAAGPSA